MVRERRASHFPRSAGTPTGAKPAVIIRAFRELIRLRLNLGAELAVTYLNDKARHRYWELRRGGCPEQAEMLKKHGVWA